MSTDAKSQANADQQTVTAEGKSVLPTIDGVVTRMPVTHVDHRGALFEIYDGDTAKWPDPVTWVYQTSVFPGVIKGWNVHESKTDRYTLTHGELLVCLYDDREGSPTAGVGQVIMMSPRGVRQVVIPVGVWHLIANIGQDETQLINLPTDPYAHGKPDRRRLPWDTDLIPLRVRDYLPANWA